MAVAHPRAVEHQRVIQERPIAVRGSRHLLEEVGELTDVEHVELRVPLELFGIPGMVRGGVMRVGASDLGIRARTQLLRHEVCRYTRQVGLIRKGEQIEHQLGMLIEGTRDTGALIDHRKLATDLLFCDADASPGDLKEEWDALVVLQEEEQLDLIRTLLDHGADSNVRTKRSPIRFGYTFHGGSPAGGSSLRATPFLLATMVGNVDVMRLLVERGADPLSASNDGTTPLMVASGMTNIEEEHAISEDRHLEAVKLCLELGADVNAANDRGNTALHATAFLGYPEIARYLVEQGAEINAKNNNGETPTRVAEGTIVTVMVFIHENVAEVLRELGGVREGIHPSFLPPRKLPPTIKSHSPTAERALLETQHWLGHS